MVSFFRTHITLVLLGTLGVALTLSMGCASLRKPCTEAGDTAWRSSEDKPVHFGGDKKCQQKKQRDGSWINEGTYREYYKSGKLGLEGAFKAGIKDGKWTQYDEKGQRVLERTFENGVEKTENPVKKTKGIRY